MVAEKMWRWECIIYFYFLSLTIPDQGTYPIYVELFKNLECKCYFLSSFFFFLPYVGVFIQHAQSQHVLSTSQALKKIKSMCIANFGHSHFFSSSAHFHWIVWQIKNTAFFECAVKPALLKKKKKKICHMFWTRIGCACYFLPSQHLIICLLYLACHEGSRCKLLRYLCSAEI